MMSNFWLIFKPEVTFQWLDYWLVVFYLILELLASCLGKYEAAATLFVGLLLE